MTGASNLPADIRFLAGDGEMARRIRAFDWASVGIGAPENWPQALKTSLRILLTTKHPVFIFWGPDLLCFYNDSYARSIGPEKHPGILGRPGREAWSEIWDVVSTDLAMVMAGKGSTWHENQRLPIIRHGGLQEVYWTYSYGPIDDPAAASGVGGVLVMVTETTERMMAERAKATEALQLRQLFDRAPGFMCVLQGPQHVFNVTNQAFVALVGRDGLIGRTVAEAVPEVVAQGFTDLLDRVYASGERHIGEHQLVIFEPEPGGAPVAATVNFVFEPIVDDRGAVTGIFCEGFDVSELALARSALRETEARFENMADNAPVMIWVTDATGYCTYLNARWHEFTGQQIGEASGLGWTGAIHPDDRDRVRDALLAASNSGKPYRSEYRLRRHDGSYHWVMDAAAPRLTDAGRFLGFVGSVIDIEDRRQSEERLRISEQRFRAAVAAVSGYVWTNSANGEMLGHQPAWMALTGQTEADYSGYGWTKAVHPDDQQPTVAAWEKAVANGSLFAFEHRVRRWDGSLGYFAIRAVPIVESGEIIEWVGVHTDITDIRRAEAELQDLNNSLEVRIAAEVQRRSQVEAALRHNQKLEALGVLTSGIAHDFNNMLTVVMSALEIVRRRLKTSDPKSTDYLAAAGDAAQRAADLVNRMLAFSRHDKVQLETVDINRILAGMENILRQACPDACAMRLRLATDAWPVRSEPGSLENAVLNLAVNAFQAMPEGGALDILTGNVELASGQAETIGVVPGSYVELEVRDTGAGMPNDVIEKAFDPFFTTKEVGKGTGLGLSQVYGLARQSGGGARIISAIGKGTSVFIYLPRDNLAAL